jgi:hypothetical protein
MSDEISEVLLDFVNGLESACAKLKHDIGALKGVENKHVPNWNPNAIKWQEAEGSSGNYERSEDVNTTEFKAMLKDLADHNNKLNREGYFYWVFQNGSTVGRKKKK